MDESLSQHVYDGQTTLNPLGLIAILVLGTAMLLLPRRYAVWPMIIMGSFVAPAQRIAVFTLNFDLLRLMVLFGTARLLIRGEWKSFRWRPIDSLLAAFAVVGTIVYIVQYGTLEAVKYKLGAMYDILGMYFLFRCIVRDVSDVAQVAIGFAVVSLPVAIAFLLEWSTGRNIFSAFGGVPDITMLRDGRLRCQGAYAHPILAGCYWASVLPLIAALWWRQGLDRWWAVMGLVCSLIIIGLCASSTPVSAVAIGVLGAGFFVMRRHMRLVRWLVLATVVILHLVMQAPVWHLISRFDLAGGSTGYYRFILIDATIRHLNEWWLLGIQSNSAWGRDYGHYVDDITNQYILEALRGGIWALGLFAALIAMAFSNVGTLWRYEATNKPNMVMSWALGVSLFVHCIIFIGVSYFGQITMLWYLTLAMIGSMDSFRASSAASAPRRSRTVAGRRTTSVGRAALV